MSREGSVAYEMNMSGCTLGNAVLKVSSRRMRCLFSRLENVMEVKVDHNALREVIAEVELPNPTQPYWCVACGPGTDGNSLLNDKVSSRTETSDEIIARVARKLVSATCAAIAGFFGWARNTDARMRYVLPLFAALFFVLGCNATKIEAYDSGTIGRGRHPDSGWGTQVFVGPLWVSMTDNHDASGDRDVNDLINRNYFKFDLSDLTETVVSAELLLGFPENAYDVDRDELLFELREVSSPHDSFGFDFDRTVLIPFSQDVWDDFGTGPSYGSRSFSQDDEGLVVTITLNEDAVAAINAAAGGVFSMTGMVASGGYGSVLTPPGGARDYLFRHTGAIETDPRFGWWTVRTLKLYHE